MHRTAEGFNTVANDAIITHITPTLYRAARTRSLYFVDTVQHIIDQGLRSMLSPISLRRSTNYRPAQSPST